ncbi:hypothetical protein MSHI_21220 [Mycobacterium shinjukuense]|uniref:Uncharacterized protein n=1 Tax=Mycobacterium shinjukuense TaxID=398694 RepID=A0A7I7MQ60_9MYCO|nr:hypothetical protein MSHI_21220 [Mycobacterium shinjukuense]
MKVAFARLAQQISGIELELHPETGLHYDDWTLRRPDTAAGRRRTRGGQLRLNLRLQ